MSALPDPATHAFRKDLADVALAGRVIASHYAEPLLRHIGFETALRDAPSPTASVIVTISASDTFRMLDCSLGWGWGYAGGLVGYVEVESIGA
ncbi:MAG TPA: SH3 domain-containing protein [Sphingomicrobium sp.]|nr:SH3 domain-containing protein [Sphingomicrobium sp.]